MKRLIEFVSLSRSQKDVFVLLILCGAAIVAVWIASMPFSSFTRQASLRRFHLGNSSFAAWAAMAPVPAMYNFENRVQFSNQMIGDEKFDVGHESWTSIQTNHFPARVITFGDYSEKLFANQRQGTFEMTSRYQSTELVTRWDVHDRDGTLVIQRRSEKWKDHDEAR